MDASKMGTKIKVDGKNQKTVLSSEEIDSIIRSFSAGQTVDDFCVTVTYEDLEAKRLSFSAGQYFEVVVEYDDLTPQEFDAKMAEITTNLKVLFQEGAKLEDMILAQLGRIRYEK